jgi:hypothetical protein
VLDLSELALDFADEESPLEDELAELLDEESLELLSLLAVDDAAVDEPSDESVLGALPLLA